MTIQDLIKSGTAFIEIGEELWKLLAYNEHLGIGRTSWGTFIVSSAKELEKRIVADDEGTSGL